MTVELRIVLYLMAWMWVAVNGRWPVYGILLALPGFAFCAALVELSTFGRWWILPESGESRKET